MSTFVVGFRKNIDPQEQEVESWQLITAKAITQDDDASERKSYASKIPFHQNYLLMINSNCWKTFLIITIIFNTSTILGYFWVDPKSVDAVGVVTIVLTHLCCLMYWVDVIGAMIEKNLAGKGQKTRSVTEIIIDLISLMPISTMYLISTKNIDTVHLWETRTITLLRIHRIPRFFALLSSGDRNYWIILLMSFMLYFAFFILLFSNLFLLGVNEYSEIDIANWNSTTANKAVVSLYFTLAVVFNVGYGDITPMSFRQMILVMFEMLLGTAFSTGIFSSILNMSILSETLRREIYRYEFEATKSTLRERKINKKLLNVIMDNMNYLWKWKKGYTGAPHDQVLPLSLRREIYFDINFVHLHRSVIFTSKPRSFLRSVSLLMKNLTYLAGDIILEPTLMSDVMICVASGVIEIMSEENDESVLFSLTAGTIIGEATLFIPLPIRCLIRAATYVEIQVLMKVHFFRLALTYPDIFRKMRAEILFRFKFKEESLEPQQAKWPSVTKQFISNIRHLPDKEEEALRGTYFSQKMAILGLYTVSENIPRVKTVPLTLLRKKPWILRPDTTLTKSWDMFLVVFIAFVAIVFPVIAGFIRMLNPWMFVLLFMTHAIYAVDVYIKATTAVERDDHFTYIASLREIMWCRLQSPGFYLDVISIYALEIYADFVWPDHHDYAVLLLSLNVLLKTWRIISYLKEQEENMHNNLLAIVTIKYIILLGVMITWGAVLLYIEARPGDDFRKERWYYQKQIPRNNSETVHPATASFYYATVTGFQLGYGDIVPTSMIDCICNIVCLITGYVVIISCVTEASSAIKHLARIRTNFQEEVFAVNRFMIEHNISKRNRERVDNYLRLQWDHDKGYSLKQLYLTQAAPNLQRRIIVLELSKSFFCVPPFRNSEPGFLKCLARLSKVRVLPPRETIMNKGSFVREMHIIENGYCEVTKETSGVTVRKVIHPMTPLGFSEMILGLPQELRVETLTHVRLLSLSHSSFLQAVTQFPDVKMEIDEDVRKYYEESLQITPDLKLQEGASEAKTHQLQSVLLSKPIIPLLKYHRTISVSYWEPFRAWGKFRLMRFLFLPISIAPNSVGMQIWTGMRIIKAVIIGFIAPIQFSVLPETHFFMKMIKTLQFSTAIDMYFCLHVAYYDYRGLLMFHPAKTSLRYLKGPFVLDAIGVFPFYWFLNYLYSESGVHEQFLIKGTALIMLLQMVNFLQGFHFLEKNILRKTEVIKTMKLLPIVLVVINLMTGLVILLQCFKMQITKVPELGGTTRLAKETVNFTVKFCRYENYNNATDMQDEVTIYKMYFYTLYWVTSTITVCGFGDIYANNEASMIVVILILTLGIFFFSYVFSSITSSMVNTNILISKHRRRILRVKKFMRRTGVDESLQQRMILHYMYNWKRTEGESPQKIFSYIHSGLGEDIISSMYESMLSRNPAFTGMEKVIVSIIGKHLEELYFLQGETIVKHKDILDNVYLIYRGEVHMVTPEGSFVLAMGFGGMFGNLGNKPFHVARESVIASENVDLIQLNRKDFFSALMSLPNTKELIDFLKSSQENYIRPKPAEAEDPKYHDPLKLNTFRLKGIPLERKGFESSHVSLVSGFSLKGTVFFLRYNPCTTYVILPGTVLYEAIEMCIFVMAYLSCVMTTYVFAFQDFSLICLIWMYLLDVMFIVEIYLQFHMTKADMLGDCIVKTSIIKKKYLKSKKLFYDIASNLPLEIFLFATPRSWWLKALSICHLNRLFRIHYVFEFYINKKKQLMTNKIYLELGWILVIVSLMIHCMACVWFFFTCPLGTCVNPSWVTEMNLLGSKAWEYYIYSAFHITSTTTSTGFQKLQIYSVQDVALTVFFMITCRYVVVVLSGLLAATLHADTYNFFMFQQNAMELKEIFKRLSMSNYQLEKMTHYMSTLWHREHGKQMPKYIVKAPYALKCDVMMAMYGQHLTESYVFSVTDEAFLRQLATYLNRFMYFPGNYIVQQGDIDHTMYFINKGEVSVMTIHPELIETVHINLTDNDNFGVQQGLILGTPHDFSYRAETDVEILSLTLTDWQHLLKYYPEDANKIQRRLASLPAKEN